MARRRTAQLKLPTPSTWGGARRGAGRKRSLTAPGPPHARRATPVPRHPVHVTMRACATVPSLRSRPVFEALRRAIAAASRRGFRVVHFSVQLDHIHFIVEADGPDALVRGVRGLSTRCAMNINRLAGRRGRVFVHRYHHRELRTPSEVRAAFAYVLLNHRKHLNAGPGVDPRSSGPWFDGWREAPAAPASPPPVAPPRTWLAGGGWRRAGGPLGFHEAPRARRGR